MGTKPPQPCDGRRVIVPCTVFVSLNARVAVLGSVTPAAAYLVSDQGLYSAPRSREPVVAGPVNREPGHFLRCRPLHCDGDRCMLFVRTVRSAVCLSATKGYSSPGCSRSEFAVCCSASLCRLFSSCSCVALIVASCVLECASAAS